MNTQQNYVSKGYHTTPHLQTARHAANPAFRQDERQNRLQPQTVQSPFQAALLFTAAKPLDQPSRAAFVCYLKGNQIVAIERLHRLRGHNPSLNLQTVLRRIRQDGDVDGVILASWVRSTSEYPYADEFTDEVERQYHTLLDAGIKLVDSLRLSETGVYSYYGQHAGPFRNAPDYHEKSISRLY